MEYVKLWLITLFILHNLIVKIEENLGIHPTVWADEYEDEGFVEGDLHEYSDDEEGDAPGDVEYGEGEGQDADTRTAGQHFRC